MENYKKSGKIREKSGNFEVEDKWQPWVCIFYGAFNIYLVMDVNSFKMLDF